MKWSPLLLLVACASLYGAGLDVYFGTSGKEARGIYHATLDVRTGKLSQAALAARMESPGFLTLHPDGRKLYAVGDLDGRAVVAGYDIGEDGMLELFTKADLPGGTGAHIAVHPSGTFLLVAHYGSGSVSLCALDADGKTGGVSLYQHEGGSRVYGNRQNAPHPHWVGFSPDGRFALVPDLGLDQIVIYAIDRDSPALQPHGVAQSIPGGGPRHMRFSTDGRFIHLLNELSLSVTTFAYDAATGATRPLHTVPALSEAAKAAETFNSAAEILVHPNGRFVYSSNRGNDSVTVFRVADAGTGMLEVVGLEPIRGAWPRNINMDPSGSWLLAAGAHSNTVSVFAIHTETGLLAFQRGNIINVPQPTCVLFAPGEIPQD